MSALRQILAIVVLAIGITDGAVVGFSWANLMWPAVAADNYNGRHALRALALAVLGAIALWWLVVWPFARLSELINPSARGRTE